MPAIDTVVIGAGHAGLAVSRLLTLEGRDHIVLDRGRVAESWRTSRWDSLHLLTPNWMARLPEWAHTGPDADGFMSAPQFVRYLERYAASFSAPVLAGVRVEEVSAVGDRYRVVTDCATWLARHVVMATGPGAQPRIPAALEGLGPDVHLTTSADYRNARQLAEGGVLVVGASASGVQIADELAAAGRDVVVAVGRHNRMPREYRGMDIYWWLERTGRTARTIDEVRDAEAARREPSMQLVGRRGHGQSRELDLRTLQARGVRLAGHLLGADGQQVSFADDLADSVNSADNRMHRFLDAVDRHIDQSGLTREVWAAERPRTVAVQGAPASLDLAAADIRTVLLATGYRQSHPWLKLPITAADGSIRQQRGRTEAPGVYVVGQRFQTRRDSGMVDGARHDAALVVADLIDSARSQTEHEALDERLEGKAS
ncbi:NAD(P)-binding domain-containing protein [Pedococcus sp. P5_B7]